MPRRAAVAHAAAKAAAEHVWESGEPRVRPGVWCGDAQDVSLGKNGEREREGQAWTARVQPAAIEQVLQLLCRLR